MTRRMVRLALAALTALLALGGAAAPAAADETACRDTPFDSGSRILFDVDERYLPRPLTVVPADCASRIAERPFPAESGWATYDLVWVDPTWPEVLALVRAFEEQGWGDDLITMVDTGSGEVENDGLLSADDLAALDEPAALVHGRFSHAPTGEHIIEFHYVDGVAYENPGDFGVPSLVVNLQIHGQVPGATGFGDPSVLSGLRTIFQAAPTPVQTGVIAGGAVVLMLVIGWPSNLLNSVVGSRYDALVRWVQRRFGRRPDEAVPATQAPAATSPTEGGSRLPGWLMWPGFALAALLGAFVDPDFGWNAMSLRVVLTLFLSFVLFNLATWAIVRRVALRLQPDVQPYLRFRWGSLAIVGIAVLVARLLDLEPGVIFGLVAGIAYAVALQASRSAIIVLVGSGFGVALALVAWVGYSLLAPVAGLAPGNAALVFLVEFLAGVTVKGVSSLPLSLLPLGNLDGVKVVRWKRWVWALAYAIGLAVFMLVLVTIPKSWGEIPGDFVRWLLLFGGYAVVAVAIWAVNAWLLAKRPPKETPVGEQPDAITID